MATRDLERAGSLRSYIGWGAIFAGGLIGVAIMVLLSSFWFAVGNAGGVVGDNIQWWIGGTAIFSMFAAGFFAGWFSGARGPLQGTLHGLTEWGLITFATLLVAPGVAGLFSLGQVGTDVTAGAVNITAGLWTVAWSLLIGLGSAVIGGLTGGLLPRPAATLMSMTERERRVA